MKKLLIPLLLFLIVLSGCAPTYTVSFNSNGGTEVDSLKIEENFELELPTNPTKDGFKFGGWFTDETLETRFDAANPITEDQTLYAKWIDETEVVYVTFVNVTDEQYTIAYEKGTILDIEDPVKEGYTFYGWYLNETLSTPFSPSQPVTENISLFPGWAGIRTVVNFWHGEMYIGGLYIQYEEIQNLPTLNLPEFTFGGWYTDPDFFNKATTVTGTLEDQTFYAKLEQKDITVPTEETVDLESLPYYDFLNDTNPVVSITVKDVGTMELQLFPTVAPNTVNNFISYIQDGDYTGSEFHRIIEGFMIQGGIVEEAHCPISGEFSQNGFTNMLSHYRGVLSTARTNDYNSATSQFFIMHADTSNLDPNYAAFGGLVSGFTVLDFIAGVSTNTVDYPFLDIEIESITIELNGYEPVPVVCYD